MSSSSPQTKPRSGFFYTALLHAMSSIPLFTNSAHTSAPCRTSFLASVCPLSAFSPFQDITCSVSCKPPSHWCASDVGISMTQLVENATVAEGKFHHSPLHTVGVQKTSWAPSNPLPRMQIFSVQCSTVSRKRRHPAGHEHALSVVPCATNVRNKKMRGWSGNGEGCRWTEG